MAEKTMGDRIREMSVNLDPEVIAQAVKMPLKVVQDVIAGEILDDALADYEPGKAQPIKVITKNKFVRSKVIGVLSVIPSALTASLAMASYSRLKHAIACIDLNEYGCLPLLLGLTMADGRIPQGMNFIWDDAFDKGTPHPQLDRLYLYSPALTTQKHNDLDTDFMDSIVGSISNEFGLTWVELPSSPRLFPAVLHSIDMILLPVMQDICGLQVFKQLCPLLREYEDRTAIVLHQVTGGISDSECRKIVRTYTDTEILGPIPYDPQVSRYAARREMFLLNNPHSPYTKAVEEILDHLIPNDKATKGISKILSSIFAKGG